jgi:hypothetical protein
MMISRLVTPTGVTFPNPQSIVDFLLQNALMNSKLGVCRSKYIHKLISMFFSGIEMPILCLKVGFIWGWQVGEPLETSPPEACADEGREGCEPFRSTARIKERGERRVENVHT